MKRFPSLIILAALSAAVCFADPVKLKFSALAELGNSLRSLDGLEKAVDQGKDVPAKIVLQPWDFKPATRLAVARDLAAVRVALEAFETTRQALLKATSPAAPEKVSTDPALLTRFITNWNDAIKDAVVVELVLVSEDDLKLDANNLPPSILTGLLPILKTK